MYVSIGSYGKDCDSTIFKLSTQGHQFRKICWNVRDMLDSERSLSESEGSNVPYFFYEMRDLR